MSDLGERVAKIEAENLQCSEERDDHGTKLDTLLTLTHQIHGAVKAGIVILGLLSTAGGMALMRYAFDHVTSARAESVVILKP